MIYPENYELTEQEKAQLAQLLAAKEQARAAYIEAIKACAPTEFKKCFGFDMSQPFYFKDSKKPYTAVFEVDHNFSGQWRKISETGANTPLSPYDYKHVKPA